MHNWHRFSEDSSEPGDTVSMVRTKKKNRRCLVGVVVVVLVLLTLFVGLITFFAVRGKRASTNASIPVPGQAAVSNCKITKSGKEYNGTSDKTRSGRTCQRWDMQRPHRHSWNDTVTFPNNTLEDAANYCRNPDEDPQGPWCLTTDAIKEWEYCNIPFCSPGEDCKRTRKGKEYRGTTAMTRSGRTCQRWDKQCPHRHDKNNPANFPDSTLEEAGDYCRNPDGKLEGPWCYTMDSGVTWDYCDVKTCSPDGCGDVMDRGPFTIACLTKWWLEAGCTINGIGYSLLTTFDVYFWQNYIVEDVQAEMASFMERAVEDQVNTEGVGYNQICFGDENRGSCKNENETGPHLPECLRKLWLLAGCKEAGTGNPADNKRNAANWNSLTVAEIRVDMQEYRNLALTGQFDTSGRPYATLCYGIENCKRTKAGEEYQETINKTRSGRICQRWDSSNPHQHSWNNPAMFPDSTLQDAANYCRNPDRDLRGPWCVTMDVNTTAEYCDVPFCSQGENCKRTRMGKEYRGITAQTRSGLTCQRWDRQIPRQHSLNNSANFSDNTVGEARNYCRNPNGEPEGPWCITTDTRVPREHCDVKTCSADGCGDELDRGPFSISCLAKWWLDAGCSVNGSGFHMLDVFNEKNGQNDTMRDVQNSMALYKKYALEDRVNSEGVSFNRLCFGNESKGLCKAEHETGPHSSQCLLQLWHLAGCNEAGTGSPDKNERNTAYWNNLTVAEIRVDMQKYLHLAFTGQQSKSGENYSTLCYDKNCKTTKMGEEYIGKIGTTGSGRTCKRWDTQNPHSHHMDDPAMFPDNTLGDAANYCRNPDKDPRGPWCYTMDVRFMKIDYCNIPFCTSGANCKRTRQGEEYRGTITKTRSGKECQRWDERPLQGKSWNNPVNFPDSTLQEAANYCRNPNKDLEGPWCFTKLRGTLEHCDVKTCSSDGCGDEMDKGPFSISCLTKWWLGAGCTAKGTGFPKKGNPVVKFWQEQVKRDVQQDMAMYTQNVEEDRVNSEGVSYSQLCYGDENRGSCKGEHEPGPHSQACLLNLWLQSGCNRRGSGSPAKHARNAAYWNTQTVADVRTNMQTYPNLALTGKNTKSGAKYATLCYGTFGKTCGLNGMKTSPISAVIYGGRSVATAKKWPWMVSMQNKNINHHFCGGALISPKWVLTAAHCTEDIIPEDIQLVFGSLNLEEPETTRLTRDVVRILEHDAFIYEKDPFVVKNDIALVELEEAVQLSPYVNTVCLPETRYGYAVYKNCHIVGWGLQTASGSTGGVLQEYEAHPISDFNCTIDWPAPETKDMIERGNTMCVQTSGEAQTCQGDSGGPLLCQQSSKHWVAAGAASWSPAGCTGNSTTKPFAYSDVQPFFHWIRNNCQCV